jgi:Domain of unknown function (DUF932)
MKLGKSLSDLAAEIERQQTVKKDYLVSTPALEVEVLPPESEEERGNIALRFEDQRFAIQETAHKQIGERLGIPRRYYEKMRLDLPELLAENVNHWFKKQPERRMVRTLDNQARAFLSDRYQMIDNFDVASVILPVFAGISGIQIKSCEITERRMYIKAVSTETRQEVKSRRVGDFVESGIVIMNSEIGLGSLSIQPFFHFLVCTNGMVRNQDGMKAYHVGRKHDLGENVYAVLSDKTKRLEDKATLSRVHDVLAASMDKVKFGEAVQKMESITQNRIQGDPVKAIEKTAEILKVSDTEQSSILRHLIEGGDLSQYGMMNAVTRTAEDLTSYDRATELETMGGYILDMPQRQWNLIATAA